MVCTCLTGVNGAYRASARLADGVNRAQADGANIAQAPSYYVCAEERLNGPTTADTATPASSA
eukprot:1163527-Pleurochrysis_carterae.AAC.1